MKYIDIDSWPRKHHYEFFKEFDFPHFNIGSNLDISLIYNFCKNNNFSLFKTIVFATTITANHIKEFKYRIRENKLIEHNIVHPSFTILTKNDLFNFCTVDFVNDYNVFINNIEKAEQITRENKYLAIEKNRDDLIYITCIPWISFTTITHPIHSRPADSVPRIAWGKYIKEHNKILLPYSVQANHSLVDGIHTGQFFNYIQDLFNNPEQLF